MNWMWNAVIAMLCIAFSNLIVAIVQKRNVSNEQILFFQSFVVWLASIWMLATNKTSPLPDTPMNIFLVVLNGVLVVGINITILPAIKSAPNPGYVLAIAAANTVIVLLASAMFLNGEITMTKGFGVLLVILGVVLVVL